MRPFDAFNGHRFHPWEPPRNMSQALRPLLGEAMTPEVLMAIEGHARTFLGPGFRMEVNGNQIAFVMDDGLLRRPT